MKPCTLCGQPNDHRPGPHTRCAGCRALGIAIKAARRELKASRKARLLAKRQQAMALAAGNSYSIVAAHLGISVGQIASWSYRERHGSTQEPSPLGHHGAGPHWWKRQKRKGRPRLCNGSSSPSP